MARSRLAWLSWGSPPSCSAAACRRRWRHQRTPTSHHGTGNAGAHAVRAGEVPETSAAHRRLFAQGNAGHHLVDTDERYLYYVLRTARRSATGWRSAKKRWRSPASPVGRVAEWPPGPRQLKSRHGSAPTRRARRRSGQSAGRAGDLSLPGQQGHALPHPRHQPAGIYRRGDLVRLYPHDQ